MADVPVTWITAADVQALLGPTIPFTADPASAMVVAAANDWAFDKRAEAGYDDDADVTPGAKVTMGTALYAVTLWRERASTDGFQSFDDLSGFAPTGGSWAQIRRLLGVGRAQVDAAPDGLVAARALRRHPSFGWAVRR